VTLTTNLRRREAQTQAVLGGGIRLSGCVPEKAKLEHLHHEAHEVCFIANSVKTKVTVT
jgi:organic hydroperoxide reductase OsmC/OhrA